MALLLLGVCVITAAGIGRFILECMGTVPEDRTLRIASSAAVGLGVVSYSILAVGLLGWLTPAAVVITLGVLAALSIGGFVLVARDVARDSSERIERDLESCAQPSPACIRESPLLRRACLVILLALGAIAIVNCFVPPAAHEWDALSYHLAAPKVYLQQHRIVFLPTDHHSNFPFLVEMLFTLGLMFDGFALANLFHFALGLLTVAALVGIGRRYFAPNAGWIAAMVFATAPIAVWEAGAAYIEHGMALYTLLSVGAALEYRRSHEARWLGPAGVFMGFALGTKALALVPAFGLAIILIAVRTRFRDLRRYLLAALVVGCPFYLKTWAWTGDPVYPFGYSVFHGRYWNDELARAYAGTQKAFGLRSSMLTASDDWRNVQPGPEPPRLTDRLRNLVVAPFALVAVPRIFYDYNDPGAFTHIGFLFLSLLPLLLLLPRTVRSSDAARLVAGLALIWYVVWSQTMQYVRYVLPLLPLVALLGGEGAVRSARVWKTVGVVATLLTGFQCWETLRYFGGQISSRYVLATDASAQKVYLERTVNHYRATEWLNRNTPQDAGVVLFEEARGFYLDRPYLWGNYFHSTYIPYGNFRTGREMADWFLAHGLRYALVNLQFSQIANSNEENRALMMAAVRSNAEAGLMLRWYGPDALGGERWRSLLGDAIRGGAAVVINQASQRGVVVIEFRASRPSKGDGTGERANPSGTGR